MKVSSYNGASFGDHGVLKGDHISSLKSHGQALEQECCFSGVLCDDGDAPVNLSCQIYGHVVPRTRCLNSKRVEDMDAS